MFFLLENEMAWLLCLGFFSETGITDEKQIIPAMLDKFELFDLLSLTVCLMMFWHAWEDIPVREPLHKTNLGGSYG